MHSFQLVNEMSPTLKDQERHLLVKVRKHGPLYLLGSVSNGGTGHHCLQRCCRRKPCLVIVTPGGRRCMH